MDSPSASDLKIENSPPSTPPFFTAASTSASSFAMGRDDRGASLRDGATNDDAVAANAARLAARNKTINGIIVSHARINRPLGSA